MIRWNLFTFPTLLAAASCFTTAFITLMESENPSPDPFSTETTSTLIFENCFKRLWSYVWFGIFPS
jgi:hypothetical protein